MKMKKNNLKTQHIIQFSFSLAILVLVGYISSRAFFRIDLTSEKRFTLSQETKKILKGLDDQVYIKVYLDGDLPIGFKKLRSSVLETLNEFRVIAGDNIQYEFINPAESNDPKARNEVYSELYRKGLKPTNIESRDEEGGMSQKTIFPGALVSYGGNEVPVTLLDNNLGASAEENLNYSTQTIEYQLIKTIYTLTQKNIEKIAFIEGHGELNELQVNDISKELSNYFQINRGAINGKLGILDDYKAVIIAKPTMPFSESDKLVLDQYIMNGGKVLWFIDEVNVNIDSLASSGSTFAFINNLNLDDQLFTYGARINPNLVMDVQCNILPVQTEVSGNKPKFVPAPWMYYPLISPLVDHPITRNLNLLFCRFVSQIDTVGEDPAIKKTVLLKTSEYTKLVNVPVMISLSEVRHTPEKQEFNKSHQAVAVLLEGKFTSLFGSRNTNNIIPGSAAKFKSESKPTGMIVVADGDFIANDVKITPQGPTTAPLGYDKYTRQTFGNKDFVVNAVNYLTDESGLISLRNKNFKLRILDKERIRNEKFKWQFINVVLPVLITMLFGVFYFYYRRKKYSRN